MWKLKMWRPENWDSPYPSKSDFFAQREAFEAGADAMHKADVEWLKQFMDFSDLETFCIPLDEWLEFMK